jgi:RND superfamily putative drug exporter
MRRPSFAARAARWSAAHRRAAVLGWLAFVLAAFALGNAAGLQPLNDADRGVGEAKRAEQLLAKEFPATRAGELVLFESRHETLAGTGYRGAVDDLVARLKRIPAVTDIRSPLSAANQGQRTADGRAALLSFQLSGDPDEAADRVGPTLAATAAVQRSHPELFVGQFGDGSANKAISERIQSDFQRAELTSLPVTLLILVLVFGALVAAGIPLLLGITAVLAALGLTALFSHVMRVDESINSVILLIGLAVGVDYSLFYLRRDREERAKGMSNDEALLVAAETSGRAVLFSGFIVMTAMAGMLLMGSQIFQGFAVGTILVVAIALVGSLTVLPAVLSKLGDNVDRGRIPFVPKPSERGDESRAWSAMIGAVLRRPALSGGIAAALLIALAIPALQLNPVDSGVQGLPRDLEVMQVYDRLDRAFPGGSLPAIVSVNAPDVTSPQVSAAIASLHRAAIRTGEMREPVVVDISASRRAARVQIPLAGEGTDEASKHALRVLRGEVIPSTIGRVPGVTVRTAGLTAGSTDFNDLLAARAPLVFAFVLSLAFVLLLIMFRSIVIPIKAIALNMLSVGAAYGVLVLIFQQGHLESLIGFRSIGGVTDWLPLFLFVILFGLSMDYHVLILSRVREYHDSGLSTEESVRRGIVATARVITSAAVVMVAVFAIFATLGVLDFKMMGVGLAVAVLIDATLVRAVLLPATMSLLGDWNWYLPRWLEWLPRIGAFEHGSPRPTATPEARAQPQA